MLLVGLLASSSLRAGPSISEKRSEHELKAAFLLKFVSYVDWPESKLRERKAPYVIGVLGPNPFGSKLATMVGGKQVNRRDVRVEYPQKLRDIQGCHMLFVPRQWAGSAKALAAAAIEHNVLLVGESPQFAHRVGVINFYLDSSKLRFEINVDASKRAELVLSSSLLRLARIVESVPE